MAQRRLAAIMFTDIVDYDSMSREDAKKAFQILRKNQQIHKRVIKKYRGRWLKEMGGGVLASFHSNIDAVICAVTIQKEAGAMDIPLRIGIHQGDVVFEKNDVLGDGVNIASRILNVSDKHGIVISGKVYTDIKNKEGIDTELIGEKALKGVEYPVEVYSVYCRDYTTLDHTLDTGELIRPMHIGRRGIILGIIVIAFLAYALYYFLPKDDLPSEPEESILILPFENYLGSDTLDYLVAGLHDELNSNIGKISALRVLSTTTANTFRNTDKSVTEITSEVGVNTLIKPSIFCTGDSICLRVEVINEEEEEPSWVKEYHEEASQIYNLFNTITKEISDEIDVTLRPQEEMMLAESRTVDPDAYNAYLKGRLNLDMFNPQSFLTAIEEFEKAIEIDPEWAAPYTGIAEVGAYQNQAGWGSRSDNILMIYKNLNKAQELDPNSFYYHYTNAVIAVWTEFDWEQGEKEFKKAIELNPSHVRCRSFYAHLLTILRRTDEAIRQGKIFRELDPNNPFTIGLYGRVLESNEKYTEALASYKEALSIEPGHGFVSFAMMEAYYNAGDFHKWFELWSARVCWEDELKAILEKVFHEQDHIAVIEELLKRHKEYESEDCWMHDSGYFNWYWKLQNYEKAMEYLENDYEENKHNPNLPYFSCNMYYNKMKENPRYITLLKKMNLPVD
jgi:TolB-like protein/Tfp pilus assembly protein PilF